ncbi:hypothetical protein ACIA5D_36415 [Actinoplanes sp. NPDC051513]|uniref:GAP1-N2 domain-containing protein n=1 Tax=Actinoplanes sp. NPDC051513 TaxID=3363908 RepID=UPI0037A3869A
MAEQLVFTWADRGLEGRGMWQVVAASEHLFHNLPRAFQLARSLCTEFIYSPLWRDPATAPVSFGWRDIRGMRFAFRRVYCGTDAFGRPGVFAAHVLVDRPERLPAGHLLGTAGSAAWWSGEPRPPDADEWMPTVTLDDFGHEAMTNTQIDAAEAVLTAVLAHKGRPVQLAMDSTVFCAALRRVAALLPGALDHLSVSTYEPSETRSLYGLTAVQPPEADPLAITIDALGGASELSGHRDVARLTMAEESRSRAYVSAAWQAASHTGDFLRVCSSYLVVRAGTVLTVADVLPGLQHPGTAADLLDDLRVRTVVARALGAGHVEVVAAMRIVGRSLEPETWSSLGELTARVATAKHGLAVAAETIRAVSAPGAKALVKELVRLALEDGSRIERLPAEVLPDVWRDPSTQASKTLENAVVRAGAASVLTLAGNRSIAANLWSRLLVEALTTGQVDPGEAAQAVHGRTAFAREVGDTAPTSCLELLLDSLPKGQALALLSVWVQATRAEVWIDLAARLASQFGDGHAWRVAAAVAPCLRRPAPAGWSSLRDEVIRRRLIYEFADPSAQWCSLAEVCRAELGTADGYWHEYLRMLNTGRVVVNWPSHTLEVARCVSQVPRDYRELAGSFALHDMVATVDTPADVAAIVHAMNPVLEGGSERIAELALRGGLRGIRRHHNWPAGFAAMTYVAVWLVGPGLVGRRKVTGELASPLAQRLAVDLYAALATENPYLDKWLKEWSQGRPRAERWLRGLGG